MEDCAEEDYSSGEDSDYVPGEASGSDSDREEEANLAQDSKSINKQSKGKGKKDKNVDPYKRKRKGGIQLKDDDPDDDSMANDSKVEQDELMEKRFQEERRLLEEEQEKQKEADQQEKEKQKSDDLWKSLLSDVGPRSKAKCETLTKTSSSPQTGSKENNLKDTRESQTLKKSEMISSDNKMVKITKVFDFAGEVVKVTKDVAANSSEARTFHQETAEQKTQEKPGLAQLPMSLKRKPGGLGSVLGKINKKSKMSVLDKSKLDWNSFKMTEGIEEDLKIHNKGKDGFLQKRDFLMAADVRQFEVEKKMRMLSQNKR